MYLTRSTSAYKVWCIPAAVAAPLQLLQLCCSCCMRYKGMHGYTKYSVYLRLTQPRVYLTRTLVLLCCSYCTSVVAALLQPRVYLTLTLVQQFRSCCTTVYVWNTSHF